MLFSHPHTRQDGHTPDRTQGAVQAHTAKETLEAREHAVHVRGPVSAHRTCADRQRGTRKHHASARVPILQNPSVGQGSAWLTRSGQRLFSPSARSMGGVAHACARCMVCRTRAQLRRRAFCRILQNCHGPAGPGVGPEFLRCFVAVCLKSPIYGRFEAVVLGLTNLQIAFFYR